MARSTYARRVLQEIKDTSATDWWFSGNLWYCTVRLGDRAVPGAGPTKEDAMRDGIRALRSAPRDSAGQQ